MGQVLTHAGPPQLYRTTCTTAIVATVVTAVTTPAGFLYLRVDRGGVFLHPGMDFAAMLGSVAPERIGHAGDAGGVLGVTEIRHYGLQGGIRRLAT